MKKAFLFSTLLAGGTALAFGTSDAHAAETYTVQSGDTLSSISVKFVGDNSLIDSIAADNGVSNYMIYAGEQLTINTDGSAAYTAPATSYNYQEPVQDTTAYQAPVQETTTYQAPAQETTYQAPATQAAPAAQASSTPASTSSAKEWIAFKESSGSYSATNGKYIGRYQLDASYLNGDYSEANQERVADQYVAGRYGSWEGAQAFWQANGWY
ncbi:LysM peptidoglycan-binding domain-containing protein [Enterococcus sp. CSURQ0835]|uniref:aggregation-promoting factor n=1 Tax=Enterococcus sp. CSURQ0835 TaxID=2681394 RepID=UPI00135B1227|nr:LysM peptidoglycan-binding domain-containing protein [Enterococcus sp. CSURQ0835]